MITEPKFYMIQMSNNTISQYYKNKVLPSWNGYNIHMFEAVTPETLHLHNDLTFDIVKSKNSVNRQFSETEKAVWYSHLLLWKASVKLNKPLIVLEHDIKLVGEIPFDKFREGNGIGMGMTYSDTFKKNVNLPCGCYYVSPYLAKVLIRTIKLNPVRINPDGFIKKFLDTDSRNWCAEQIIDKNVGTTIVHFKSNMV